MTTGLTNADSLDSAVLNDLMHMGWLHPFSPASKVICPDLVEQAGAKGWQVKRFVGLAAARVPIWIRSKLAVRNDVLDTITQNFVLRMMERRPDLFHDPLKNTLEAYLVGLLRVIERETWRQESPAMQLELSQVCNDALAHSPDAAMEQQELAEIATLLVEQLPYGQREAIQEKYSDGIVHGVERQVPARVIHVRRSRALMAMRDTASLMGLCVSSRDQRRRMHRCKRTARRRGLRRRCGNTSTHSGKLASQSYNTTAPTHREIAIEVSNGRALQRLITSLPDSVRDSGEVLARVTEIFHQRFARRLTRCNRSLTVSA